MQPYSAAASNRAATVGGGDSGGGGSVHVTLTRNVAHPHDAPPRGGGAGGDLHGVGRDYPFPPGSGVGGLLSTAASYPTLPGSRFSMGLPGTGGGVGGGGDASAFITDVPRMGGAGHGTYGLLSYTSQSKGRSRSARRATDRSAPVLPTVIPESHQLRDVLPLPIEMNANPLHGASYKSDFNMSDKKWHTVVFPALTPANRQDVVMLSTWLNGMADRFAHPKVGW